jgi:hypothetical protein
MAKFYDFLYGAVSSLLATATAVPNTEEKLKNLYEEFRDCYPGETVDTEQLLREALANNKVFVDDFSILEDKKDHEEWLADENASIKWLFWKRYKQYLIQEKLPASVIEGIDESTDAILGRLESPRRRGAWDRRGMVVGSVQSGKTSNYLGLICKAVDAGYKVVIVLAGLNNDLRSQTQKRIDKGFLGMDTSKKDDQDQSTVKIGVGKLPGYVASTVLSLTSSAANGDFKKGVHRGVTITPGCNPTIGDPVILVVKKNVSPLKNVYQFFSSLHQSKKIGDSPLLLIDDEADNASIDTKALNWIDGDNIIQDEQDPTKINRYIRQILNVFSQSAYVGYTATPFANIFIYPHDSDARKEKYGEDLFPRSFIVNLKAPSNYLGAERLFGLHQDSRAGIQEEKQPLPLVRCISDYSRIFPPKHKKTHAVSRLPDSLVEAVFAFILSNAVRNVRKIGNKHQSMLIHVTRYTDVQHQITHVVRDLIRDLKSQFEGSTGPLYEGSYRKLKKLWDEDFVKTHEAVADETLKDELPDVTWDQVREILFQTIAKIEVKEINGKAKDGGLNYDDYPNGCSVIAIGGDKLSRGLTLEGLCISYYTRPTEMYDTLLQMGRWFGYRKGCLDVCRLYTSRQHIKAYRHIAVADYELRKEFETMVMLQETPETYGLKIRTDPEGQLRITAYNKMRNSMDISVTFAGKTLQTTRFHRKHEINAKNLDWLRNWIPTIAGSPSDFRDQGNAVVFKNISPDRVCEFLSNITIHKAGFDSTTVNSYIRQQNKLGELVSWTVALISPKSPDVTDIDGHSIGLSWRTDATPDFDYLSVINNQLIKEMDERIDLTPEQEQRAKELTLKYFVPKKHRPNPPKSAGPYWVKQVREKSNGLLLIYLIRSGTAEGSVKKTYDEIYVGYAVSFPASVNAKPIHYKADAVYQGTLADEFGVDDEL